MTITVVIPVYNVAPYVERCVQSVMRQTYPASECVIVDDASPDCSISLCQKLIEKYSGPTHFIILHHETNRGLSAARNTGTHFATSDYIYYLDSDDEMTPDCLEKLAAPVLKDDRIEMSVGGYLKDYSQLPGMKNRLKQCFLQRQITWRLPQSSNLSHILYLYNSDEIHKWFYTVHKPRPFYVWNKLLLLSFVKENNLYNHDGLLFEDHPWSFLLIRCLNRMAIVNGVTYIQHFRPGSIQTSTKYVDVCYHNGCFYRVLAEYMFKGERIDALLNWLQSFCRLYVDSIDNPDYQYAYNSFLQRLAEGNYRCELI